MTESIVVEDNRVILRGELATEALFEDIYGDGAEEFNALFEIVGVFLASDKRYRGLDVCTVIERKSDGERFGYMWWDDISKHGEPYYDSNGDEHGLEDNAYVWLPVEPFTIQGFRVKK